MKDESSAALNHNSFPIIFGEVLFDTFPDGVSVLGGAPFNVAWHLKGFGLEPHFISRVGNDANGQRVRQAMTDWGMDVSGLQEDYDRQTGIVSISLNNGQPAFDILPDQAYDHIDSTQARASIDAGSSSLLYFGTLINRSDVSRTALTALRQLNIPCYVDINLREPWWNADMLDQAVRGSRWLKLNDIELAQFSERSDFSDAAKELIHRYHLDWVIITKGADGAMIVTENQESECQPVILEHIKDTVGAGDAFSAVSIYGILSGWPIQTILQRAVEFAASICMQRGATVNNQSFYENVVAHWQKD